MDFVLLVNLRNNCSLFESQGKPSLASLQVLLFNLCLYRDQFYLREHKMEDTFYTYHDISVAHSIYFCFGFWRGFAGFDNLKEESLWHNNNIASTKGLNSQKFYENFLDIFTYSGAFCLLYLINQELYNIHWQKLYLHLKS